MCLTFLLQATASQLWEDFPVWGQREEEERRGEKVVREDRARENKRKGGQWEGGRGWRRGKRQSQRKRTRAQIRIRRGEERVKDTCDHVNM